MKTAILSFLFFIPLFSFSKTHSTLHAKPYFEIQLGIIEVEDNAEANEVKSKGVLDLPYHRGYTYEDENTTISALLVSTLIRQEILTAISKRNDNYTSLATSRYPMVLELNCKATLTQKNKTGDLYHILLTLENEVGRLAETEFDKRLPPKTTKTNPFIAEEITAFLLHTNQQELHKKVQALEKTKQEKWKAIYLINTDSSAIQSAIMTVSTEHGHGSGVLISKDGYVITNHHVIMDANNVTVIDAAKTNYKAKVIRTNAKSDLALLKVENATFNASAKISTENNARIGTAIICAGSPLTTNLNQTVSEGIISGYITQKGFQHYAFSATVHPGNSGGGLFNAQGELIGIVSARANEGQQIGLAIPVSQFKRQLKLFIE